MDCSPVAQAQRIGLLWIGFLFIRRNRALCETTLSQRAQRRVQNPERNHYSRDFGSDLFTGDFLSSRETSCCADAGTPTFPPRMISLAVSFLLYSFSFALPSERNVEPSRETPANNPLLRE